MAYESRMYALAPGTLAAVDCPPMDGQSWHCGNCYEAILSHNMTTCPKCGAEVWVEVGVGGNERMAQRRRAMRDQRDREREQEMARQRFREAADNTIAHFKGVTDADARSRPQATQTQMIAACDKGDLHRVARNLEEFSKDYPDLFPKEIAALRDRIGHGFEGLKEIGIEEGGTRREHSDEQGGDNDTTR